MRIRILAGVVLCALAAVPARSETGPETGTEPLRQAGTAAETGAPIAEAPLRIGVAPFEGVAAGDALLPDLATLLADRLGRVADVEVVGPAALGAPPVLDPDAEQVRRWAQGAGLDAVVVGRTTRAAEPVSLDLRLRSGTSGEVRESWFREMPSLDAAAATLDGLIPELVAGARALRSTPAAAEPDRSHFGLAIDRSAPLSITSEQLEASQSGGARHLVFSQNVEVHQADVKITARRLEAFYPAGSNRPERLIASGDVALAQGTREGRCDEATYERSAQRLICRGNAALQDGDDRVAGEEIEFDLENDSVTVTGRAAVVFEPHPRAAAKTGVAE